MAMSLKQNKDQSKALKSYSFTWAIEIHKI